jgi:carboxyl-terminal processing protease
LGADPLGLAQASIASAFVMRKASELPRQTGIWRSRGYGWIWVIKNGRLKAYDAADGYCSKKGNPLEDLRDRFEVSGDGNTLRVSFDDPDVHYVFDRIDALPAACHAPKRTDAPAVVDAVASIFSAHYAFFAERNIDWPAAVAKARPRVSKTTTDAELFTILRDMVSVTDDYHIDLSGRVDGAKRSYSPGRGPTINALAAQAADQGLSGRKLLRRWEKRYWSEIGKTVLKGRGHRAGNGVIRYGFAGEGVGYIAIRSMTGFTNKDTVEAEIAAVEDAMERTMRALKSAKAIILDLSQNDGGYDYLARLIAGRFAAEGTFAYSKRAGDYPDAPPQKLYVEPSKGRRFTGPVYVLTTDETVSAGEILTMCLRALPNVTHVGEVTRGVFSDTLHKRLPNGWSLTVSNEVYTDSEGKLWEGPGIPPQVDLEVFSKTDVMTGHVAAVGAVVDMARSSLGL